MFRNIKKSFQVLESQGVQYNMDNARKWLNRLSGLIFLAIFLCISLAFFLCYRSDNFIAAEPSIQSLRLTYGGVCVVLLLMYMVQRKVVRYIFDCLHDYQEIAALKQKQVENNMRNLAELNVQLKQSNVELETFAYSVSHDLKEPMRMVTSFSKLLERKLAPYLDTDSKQYFEFVKEGVLRLQSLLEGILDFSRLGNSKEKLIPIDLDDVLFYVQKNLKMSIETAQAKIEIQGSLPNVMARYSEMVQLFQNILSNSIKFRHQGVTPMVKVACVKQGESYTISIQDNGIGIPKEYSQKIFEPFERLHTRTAYEGSGIGLAICKKIVEQYNGSIWFESEVGQGTTFFVRLPVLVNTPMVVAEAKGSIAE